MIRVNDEGGCVRGAREHALKQATDKFKVLNFEKFDKLTDMRISKLFLYFFIGKRSMNEDYIECNHFVNYQILESCSGKLLSPCQLK